VPGLAGRVDSLVGLDGFSQSIRAGKERLDSLGAFSASGATATSATGGLVDRTRAAVDQARALYDTTQVRISESREFIDRKSGEFQSLMKSMQEAKEIADKLQGDLDALTTLSASGSAELPSSEGTEASLRALEENMREIRTLSGSVSATGSTR
jgi:hypothetical protein